MDIVEPEGIRRLTVHHSDPAKVALAREFGERWPPDLDAPSGVPQVIRSGEATLLPEIPDAVIDQMARSQEHAEAIRGLGLRSALLVPMIARDQVLGVITFVGAESGRIYGDEDLELAQALAERAAMAVDSARLYRDAREAARARDEIVAMVSHDLRNPLNAVLAGASLLLDVPLGEEKREQQLKVGPVGGGGVRFPMAGNRHSGRTTAGQPTQGLWPHRHTQVTLDPCSVALHKPRRVRVRPHPGLSPTREAGYQEIEADDRDHYGDKRRRGSPGG